MHSLVSVCTCQVFSDVLYLEVQINILLKAIKSLKHNFNKFKEQCACSKWFIDYFKIANEFYTNCLLLLLILRIHISGPATVQN